jgi:uncharacterized protein
MNKFRRNKLRLETYRDKNGLYRGRVFAGNGRQLSRTSKGFEHEDYIDRLVELFGEKHKAEIYKDKKGEWRWRFSLPEYGIIMISSEGYKNKRDCLVSSVLVLKSEIIH